MKANLETAATRALETLIKYKVTSAPVIPLPILKSMPGVLVVPFAEMADYLNVERTSVMSAFGSWNQDAVTTYRGENSRIKYLVTYNQRLPFYMQQRALSRELGHIILGHDGTRPDDVRQEEAIMFARHFLCPRPLVKAMQESGLNLTVEMVGNITGCYERCLAGIRKTPGVVVPAELNREVKKGFADYVQNFLDCRAVLAEIEESAPVDFGTYMDGYVE